jgi:hypothetical protein
MGDSAILSGSYRIEVSGWGLDDAFFVEKTDLLWAEAGEKRLFLHRALADGAVIFVRLLAPESSFSSVPVAYQVKGVQPTNSSGLCEMRLSQLHPRSRPHNRSEIASPLAGRSSKACEPKESSIQSELEEVLHEA